jgi:hypothetical protein
MSTPPTETADRPTDHSHRDLAQLHLDVAFGKAGGKIIWQPRILAWYDDKIFAGEALPAPYTGMSLPQIYRALGCSNRVYEYEGACKCQDDAAVRFSRRDLDASDYELRWDTPVGSQRAIYRRSKDSPWHKPIKWPVSDEEEMKVAAWRTERMSWSWDQRVFDRVAAKWHGLGAPTMNFPRTTLQHLYINDMGIEAATYALQDYPATCERYFEALILLKERLIEEINARPIHLINFGDNLHAGTMSPKLFEKHILPLYQRWCRRLHAAGKFVYSHWDGLCKPLLPYARETGLDGIEAITPLPQGDVTLEETKKALGDMFLLDGIPAVFFDPTYSEQTLIDCAKKCIDLFAPHLILGASDEVSSHGEIERVRLVGKIVDDYNATRGNGSSNRSQSGESKHE